MYTLMWVGECLYICVHESVCIQSVCCRKSFRKFLIDWIHNRWQRLIWSDATAGTATATTNEANALLPPFPSPTLPPLFGARIAKYKIAMQLSKSAGALVGVSSLQFTFAFSLSLPVIMCAARQVLAPHAFSMNYSRYDGLLR